MEFQSVTFRKLIFYQKCILSLSPGIIHNVKENFLPKLIFTNTKNVIKNTLL